MNRREPKCRVGCVAEILVALTLITGVPGCRHEAQRAPLPPPLGVALPPDVVVKGELLDTPDEAFGLSLPEGLTVTKRLYANVVLIGTRPLDDVVEYIRQRVDAEVESGPGWTSFIGATVKKPQSDWRGTLRIEVARRGATTVVELWGEVPPLAMEGAARALPSTFQSAARSVAPIAQANR